MDLSRFIMDEKSETTGKVLLKKKIDFANKLAMNEDFKREVRSSSIIAAAHASKFISKRPYVSQKHEKFIGDHNYAWARLVTNLKDWTQSSASLELPRKERVMVAAWHFPELPTIFAYAKKIHALVLVTQDMPWMTDLKEAGCVLNISSPKASVQLAHEMKDGRIIGGVLDHFHLEMEFKETKFLGQNIRRHSGILELCSRFNYLIAFVASRAEGVQVVGQIDAAGRSPEDLAQQYSDWLEIEVRRAPEAWLMWQSLPSATIRI